MEFNRWWDGQADELYWLEITDRTDLGVDLNAPQLGKDGKEQWHYSLINEVAEGDVVFHYHRAHGAEGAIVAWSRATGRVWDDEVVWAPHAGTQLEPARQAGRRLGLEGFHPLPAPLTLADLRVNEDLIRVLQSELVDRTGGATYTPFETGDRQTRPKQAYLTKLPAELVQAIPALRYAAGEAATAERFVAQPMTEPRSSATDLGEEYRRPDEDVLISTSDPMERDPTIAERGLRGHAMTQNALADYLLSIGVEPRSPRADEPNFDLAWGGDETVFVAEVKSLTLLNEERQLRLGLGQVLRYRQLLAERHDVVVPVLVAEREPTDRSWLALCDALAIRVLWPGAFDRGL